MVINTPGSRWRAIWTAPEPNIVIGSLSYPISLIALKSTDLDVILGMDWLVRYKAVIDCAARSVNMTHPSGETVRYRSPSSVPSSATSFPSSELCAMDATPTLEIQDVQVVLEFPDVFPEELPGMPPDRSVEFVSE